MGNLLAIHHAGNSLADYLRRVRPAALNAIPVQFYGLGQFSASPPADTTLVILLYAVSIDEHHRNATRTAGPHLGTIPLGVNLHLLVIPWSDDPEMEHHLLAWAMREFHRLPVLDRSILIPTDAWEREDRIQISAIDMTPDQVYRLWEALQKPYRLCAPYLARVVKIDVAPGPDGPPVVAKRLAYTQYGDEPVAPIVDHFNQDTGDR
jgi:hypothetical protein